MNILSNDDILNSFTSEDLENFAKIKRENMRRKEILAKYTIKRLPPPDGRYWVRIEGKQYFRKTRSELENKIMDLMKEEEVTIAAIYDEFMLKRKREVASATVVTDLRYYNMYIKDSKLANIPVKDITISDGDEFFDHVKSIKCDLKEKYWFNVKSSLDMIMEYCIEKHYIMSNPFEKMTVNQENFTAQKETPDEDTIFSNEEQILVCELAEKDAIDKHNAIPLGVVLLFHTGLRIGELIAAKWCDVEYIGGKPHLYIRRIQVGSVNENGLIRGRETANRCKSKRSRRKVPLNSKCMELLEQIKNYNVENGFPTEDNDYIFFRNVKGEIRECTERCFAGRLKKYCKKIGMVNKSPHDIRRTALTNLWLSGVPIKIVQLIAGHNTQKQTEDYLKITEKEISKYDYTERLVESKIVHVKGRQVRNNVLPFPKRA